jgi:hypothetical protein
VILTKAIVANTVITIPISEVTIGQKKVFSHVTIECSSWNIQIVDVTQQAGQIILLPKLFFFSESIFCLHSENKVDKAGSL